MKKYYELHKGSNLDILPELIKQGIKVDSIVTDPPYHLTSIVKRFGKTTLNADTQTSERSRNKSDGMARLAKGFMGKSWDGGDIAYNVDLWKMCYEVLKPGGYLLAFGGTRTQHRMVCAIEDAGFEIRDQMAWMYASGMPKSLNIGKAIDKHFKKTRTEVIGSKGLHNFNGELEGRNILGKEGRTFQEADAIMKPVTPEAEQWEGWGTGLKPAWEPICVARKPIEGTVAKNIMKYGTGGMNIEGSRVPLDMALDQGQLRTMKRSKREDDTSGQTWGFSKTEGDEPQVVSEKGRWPANFIHDGSEEVMDEFAKYGVLKSGYNCTRTKEGYFGAGDTRHGGLGEEGDVQVTYGDSGSAARFFYCAKASSDDRGSSKHPTIKPLSLMSYLVKLVTPPSGVVLDIFAGSGTTGYAAAELGFYPIMIERDPEYQKDILDRMSKFDNDPFYQLFNME